MFFIPKEVHTAKNGEKKMTCYIEHIDFYFNYTSFCRSKRKLTNETVKTMHRPQTEYVKIIADEIQTSDMEANGQKKMLCFQTKIKADMKSLE